MFVTFCGLCLLPIDGSDSDSGSNTLLFDSIKQETVGVKKQRQFIWYSVLAMEKNIINHGSNYININQNKFYHTQQSLNLMQDCGVKS